MKIKYNNPQRAIETLSINVAILIFSFIPAAIYALKKKQAYLDKDDHICTAVYICHSGGFAFTGSESPLSQICYLSI